MPRDQRLSASTSTPTDVKYSRMMRLGFVTVSWAASGKVRSLCITFKRATTTRCGRFLQRDPAQDSAERYAYQAFGGSPLVYADPMGTTPEDKHLGDALAEKRFEWLHVRQKSAFGIAADSMEPPIPTDETFHVGTGTRVAGADHL